MSDSKSKANELKRQLLNIVAAIFLNLFKYLRRLSTEYPEENTPITAAMNESIHSSTIVICTFEDRFFKFALPLIHQIREESDIPIILIINGNLDRQINSPVFQEFLKKSLAFSNIFPVSFLTFQGCAKMWNTGILHADSEVVIVLNDDIQLIPGRVQSDFLFAAENAKTDCVTKINGSWSHFAISKRAIRDLGWFDERFLGIGEEDGDYQTRYFQEFGREIPTTRLISFVNLLDSSRDEGIAKGVGKYSLFNRTLATHKSFKQLNTSDAKSMYPVWLWRQRHLPDLKVETTDWLVRALNGDL